MLTTVDKVLEDRWMLSDLNVEALTVKLPPVDLSLTRDVPLTVSKLVATKFVTLIVDYGILIALTTIFKGNVLFTNPLANNLNCCLLSIKQLRA